MSLLLVLARGGLVVGASITGAGLLAPFYPPLEMANHFRPWVMLGCVLLVALQLAARTRYGWRAITALTAVNGLLIAVPLGLAARPVDGPDADRLKIVSLNVWGGNQRLGDVAAYLRGTAADVVALQELPRRNADALLPMLRDVFPHQAVCGRCRNLAVLSRLPIREVEEHPAGDGRPGLLVARLARPDGRSIDIVALHPAYPFRPFDQARHFRWLAGWLARQPGTLIAVGDFNMTPWAWKMWRLQRETGLVRHGTWHRSWSGHLPLQTFLIDNVLTTRDIRAVAFATGPDVGSDHLPIAVTLALP